MVTADPIGGDRLDTAELAGDDDDGDEAGAAAARKPPGVEAAGKSPRRSLP